MKTTPAEIIDLVEYSLNEVKPKLKTKRGSANEFELSVGRQKFIVKVEPKRRKQAA